MRRPSALLLLAGAPVCFAAEVMFASSESTCIMRIATFIYAYVYYTSMLIYAIPPAIQYHIYLNP